MSSFMTKDEMLSYAIRKRRHFEALVYVDALGSGRQDKLPELTFSKGNHSSASNTLITIGVGGLKAKTEEELFMQIVHMIGLQIQHLKSTVGRDWEACEMLALRNFCDRLYTDIYGSKGRFHKESDYERFFKELEANEGIHLSVHTIKELVNYIAGTLEEGRVERIRSEKNLSFLEYRRVARGSLLLNRELFPEGTEEIAYENLNPAEHLKALQQQISFLATCEKFQRGFLRNYIQTPFYDEVKEYIPSIWKAVTAKTCKECMGYALDVLDMMYPRILDAAKYKGGIESMLKSLMEMQANSPSDSSFNASPSDEETGSGEKPEKLFDNSDLEVTLDDESYDKLMTQQDGSNQRNEDGVKVKREHDYDEKPFTQTPPPTPPGSKDDDGAEGSEGSQGPNAGSDSKGSNESNDGKENSTDSSSGASGSDSSDGKEASDEQKDSQGGAVKESTEEDNPGKMFGDNKSSGTSAQKESGNEDGQDKASGNINDTGASASDISEEEAVQSIINMMKEAAENIQPDMQLAEKEEQYEKEFMEKMKTFKTPPLPAMDTTDIGEHYRDPVSFKEVTRVYTPNIALPFGLDKKGKSLKRKIEEILQNKQSPDRRGMRSGSIDGTRLYKLISSETTIFKKRGEKNKPDIAGFLLMDNSGSMGYGPGSTRQYACNAFSVIEEAFKEFMPLKIAAFDAQNSRYVMHEVIKDFDEVEDCNFTHNFCRQGRRGCGNKDGYSIRVATKQLLSRPEKEKILIVASDGLPSDYSYGESGIEDVKSAVADARSKGIKVIGMYMYSYADDRTFQQYHEMYAPDYLMVTMDEIEKELTRIMKRLFTK